MGGVGSGRHWQFGADTTDDYRSIDIRWLKRDRPDKWGRFGLGAFRYQGKVEAGVWGV